MGGSRAVQADGRQRTYECADPAPSAAAARGLDGISRTALATARLTDAGGKLHAQATSSCMIFRPGR
jgi:hypothetical protein